MHYPYLPKGKMFIFASADDPHMQEAALARDECAGDRLFPVGAVLVREGKVIARAGNGYNRGKGFVHVCPRIVLECPSGTGYELCQFHDAQGHAEPMLVAAAKEQGINPSGCDVYLYGHWWCCEPCWKVMLDAGVRNVYLLENAHEEFERDRVYAQTLRSSKPAVFVSEADWKQPCMELGCEIVKNKSDADVLVESENGVRVLRVVKAGVVQYEIGYQTLEEAKRLIKNILRQL